MSDGLTARQIQILKSLIDEYIETAQAVGSEALEKKYSLGVSPATVRNEMVELTKSDYLRQLHTSAGRVPTPKAIKFYIDQLMEEKQMSVTEEVKAKEEVWDVRDDLDALMREATHSLAERTKNLAVATLDEGNVWHSGYSNVFLNPEFMDIRLTANVFSLLDEVRRIHELFFERMTGDAPVEVIFGEELGWPNFDYISVCGTRFRIGQHEGAIGVVGPSRLSYPTVIPVVRYFRDLLQDISNA